MLRRPSSVIFLATGNSFVSGDLAKRLRLGLEEPATVREQLTPLISLPDTSGGNDRAGCLRDAAFLLHQIEKLLKLIAGEWDLQMPSSEAWHQDC